MFCENSIPKCIVKEDCSHTKLYTDAFITMKYSQKPYFKWQSMSIASHFMDMPIKLS